MMLEIMLEDSGCIVALAPSVEKALASILTHAPDGVLLDMNLHGKTTIPVAEELARRSVPFLLVTGYGAGDDDPPMIKAAPRVQKPFDVDDLTRRMAEVFVAG